MYWVEGKSWVESGGMCDERAFWIGQDPRSSTARKFIYQIVPKNLHFFANGSALGRFVGAATPLSPLGVLPFSETLRALTADWVFGGARSPFGGDSDALRGRWTP